VCVHVHVHACVRVCVRMYVNACVHLDEVPLACAAARCRERIGAQCRERRTGLPLDRVPEVDHTTAIEKW
jgi:hypothetical protein